MENKETLIIYCKCGKNAIAIGNPDSFDSKEISEAIKEKRKVEVVDFAKYKEMDIKLYCPEFVKENKCPNNEKTS